MKTTTTRATEYANKLTGSEAYKESMIYAKFGAQIGIKNCTSLSKLSKNKTTTIKNTVTLFLNEGQTATFKSSEPIPNIRERFLIGSEFLPMIKSGSSQIQAITIE